MTRATSPQDRLGGCDALPVPLIEIGMKVQPRALGTYERQRILRSMIADTVRIVGKLRREGYMQREPGTTLLHPHNKNSIRASMRVIDTAYEVQVASVVCVGHHVGRNVVNQCYVGGVPGAASGVEFYGQLLFRAVDDQGRRVCVLQPLDTVPYTFCQRELHERRLPEPAL